MYGFDKYMLLPYSAHALRQKCIRYAGDEVCSICLCPLNSKPIPKYVRKLPCNHLYHGACIDKWAVQKSCPLCRTSYFFDCWHAVDPYVDGTYYQANANSRRTHNYRYRKSWYNLVLFELRRYIRQYVENRGWTLREHKRCLTINSSILRRVQRIVQLVQHPSRRNRYFRI